MKTTPVNLGFSRFEFEFTNVLLDRQWNASAAIVRATLLALLGLQYAAPVAGRVESEGTGHGEGTSLRGEGRHEPVKNSRRKSACLVIVQVLVVLQPSKQFISEFRDF